MASVLAMSEAHRFRHPGNGTHGALRKGPDLGLGAGIGTSNARMPRPTVDHSSVNAHNHKPHPSPQPAKHTTHTSHTTYSKANPKDRPGFPGTLSNRPFTAGTTSAQSSLASSSNTSPSRLPTLAAKRDRRDLYPSANGDSASSSQATLRPPNSASTSPQKQLNGDYRLLSDASLNGYRSNASSTYSSPASRNNSPDPTTLSRSQLASPFQPSAGPSKLTAGSWRTGLDRLQDLDLDFSSQQQRPSYGLAGLSEDDDREDDTGYREREQHKRDSDRFTAVPRPSRSRSKPRNRDRRSKIDVRALASPPPLERRQTAPTEDSHDSSAASAGTSGTNGTHMTTMDLSALSHSTGSTAPTTVTNGTSSRPHTYLDNDEMHLALLAGQAAVDCDKLPISTWDEVELWKKELSHLSSRLDTLQARHQREVKILTAARTLQKLNTANKRISRHTMESLEQSERRVAAAEKVSASLYALKLTFRKF